MRSAIRRTFVALLAAALAILLVQSPASAGSGCSKQKTVPGASVYYTYCDSNGSDSWTSTASIINHHGADITLVSQINLQIDGGNRYLDEWYFTYRTSDSYVDPYNRKIGSLMSNNCTPGHTYFPQVKLKVYPNGAWGPWAGAGKFICGN